MKMKLWSLNSENKNEFMPQHVPRSTEKRGHTLQGWYNWVEYGIPFFMDVNKNENIQEKNFKIIHIV